MLDDRTLCATTAPFFADHRASRRQRTLHDGNDPSSRSLGALSPFGGRFRRVDEPLLAPFGQSEAVARDVLSHQGDDDQKPSIPEQTETEEEIFGSEALCESFAQTALAREKENDRGPRGLCRGWPVGTDPATSSRCASGLGAEATGPRITAAHRSGFSLRIRRVNSPDVARAKAANQNDPDGD